VIAHKLMNEKYGDRVQIVIDDAAVTQLRFIIPFLAAKDRKDRAGNSVLIKLNQAGTFTETCLATEVVLGVADAGRVKRFLDARGDTGVVLSELATVAYRRLTRRSNNMKAGCFSAFFSHRSTEGTSEFLPFSCRFLYGSVSRRVWFKAGAPNGERNLQNLQPAHPRRRGKFATQASGPLWPASRVCPRASRFRRCVDISPRVETHTPSATLRSTRRGVLRSVAACVSHEDQGPVLARSRATGPFLLVMKTNTGPYLHRWRAGPIL